MKKNTSAQSSGASSNQTPPELAAENLGKVEISPEAIATIVSQTIIEKGYGVVGLAARRLRGGKADILRPEHYRDGISIRLEGERIYLDLYLIIEYGLRVSEVAHNIMSTVKSEVERHLGLEVAEVNINVQGLRMPVDETRHPRRANKQTKDSSNDD